MHYTLKLYDINNGRAEKNSFKEINWKNNDSDERYLVKFTLAYELPFLLNKDIRKEFKIGTKT